MYERLFCWCWRQTPLALPACPSPQVELDRKEEAKRRKKAEDEAKRRKEASVWLQAPVQGGQLPQVQEEKQRANAGAWVLEYVTKLQ